MSILKKVSNIIPGKGDDKEYYLALLITYQGVETALWYLEGNTLKTTTFGNASFIGAGNILETAAEAIDQACEPQDVEVRDVILGLPDSWISNNQILPQYFEKLKELAKNLDIVPFAFVSQNHAIVNRLKIKYGTTICGFLLNVDNENVTLSSIKSGHLVQTRFVRADQVQDLGPSIQKLFAHFTLTPQESEYIYVAGHPIPPNLEEAITSLSVFSMQKPKITRLDPEFAVRSIALAGAVDRGNLSGLHVEDEETDEVSNAQVGVMEPSKSPVHARGLQKAATTEPTVELVPVVNQDASAPPKAKGGEAVKEDHQEATTTVTHGATIESVPPPSLPEGFVVNKDIAQELKDAPDALSEKHDMFSEDHVEAKSTVETPENAPEHKILDEESISAKEPGKSDAGPRIQHAAAYATAVPNTPMREPMTPKPQGHNGPFTKPQTHEFQGHKRRLFPSSYPTFPLFFLHPLQKVFGMTSGTVSRFSKLAVLLIVPLVLLVIVVISAFTLAKAQVDVVFTPKALTNTLALTVNPSITAANVGSRQIPGSTMSTDVSGELSGNATGKKKVGDKATGSVTIFNKTGQAKAFPKNTAITTNDLTFVLSESVTVPQRTATESADREIVIKPGKATASVAADDIGSEYNVPSGTDFLIKGSAKDSFDAQAVQAFSGGSSKDVTIVTEDDIKRTEVQLTGNLKEQAKTALLGKVDANQQIIDDSITVAISKRDTSKKAGDEATSFTLQAVATAKATVYAKDALQTLVESAVKDQIPNEYTLSENGLTGQAQVKSADKDGNVLITWYYQANLVPKVNEEEMKKKIVGKSFAQVTNQIQTLPNVASVTVVVTPSPFQVFKRLPFSASKITLTMKSAQ